VDDCIVEVDGDEVPIVDGSAAPWVELVARAGVVAHGRSRRVRRIVEPLHVTSGSASLALHPADRLTITCAIEFAHPAIGRQEISVDVTPDTFRSELAPARTFGFLRDVEALRRQGLARGGSYDNAIVLGDDAVLNGPLRFADEFVRHKAMDLVGDLALTGMPLLAHVESRAAGHRLNVELSRLVLESPEAWRIEEWADEPVAVGATLAGLAATPALSRE
jgi:UDP-3-O-[3-hydroxymyristoyl] N-acetylglucosamine deacetylase